MLEFKPEIIQLFTEMKGKIVEPRKIVVSNCKNQIQIIADENNNLRQEITNYQNHIDLFKVPKPNKNWENLRSPASTSKRKSQLSALFRAVNDVFA